MGILKSVPVLKFWSGSSGDCQKGPDCRSCTAASEICLLSCSRWFWILQWAPFWSPDTPGMFALAGQLPSCARSCAGRTRRGVRSQAQPDGQGDTGSLSATLKSVLFPECVWKFVSESRHYIAGMGRDMHGRIEANMLWMEGMLAIILVFMHVSRHDLLPNMFSPKMKVAVSVQADESCKTSANVGCVDIPCTTP